MLHPSLLAILAWFVVSPLNVCEKINSITANGFLVVTQYPQGLSGTAFLVPTCSI